MPDEGRDGRLARLVGEAAARMAACPGHVRMVGVLGDAYCGLCDAPMGVDGDVCAECGNDEVAWGLGACADCVAVGLAGGDPGLGGSP